MAAQGSYSYPAYGPTAPPCPIVQDSQGPYPPPPQYYGVPAAGYAVPQQGYAAYIPPTAPMLGQQVGGPTHPQVQRMETPAYNPNYPPGLEYLTTIDQLLVHQIVELLEALIGFESQNKYEVKNSLGQRVYFAVEDSDFCNRMCCGANRAFTIKILDNIGQPVMHFTRPLGCGSCCCPCCLHTMEVEAPPGNTIGYVTQEWHPFQPRFNIQDEKHQTVLKIKGPCLAFNCFGDVDFEVVSLDESTIVGRITKQWSGLTRELFTDSDNFGIQFPIDLDVKVKAILLGACLLVDFMYFEQKSGANQGGGWQLG